jgi:hypothetical protein
MSIYLLKKLRKCGIGVEGEPSKSSFNERKS